MDEKKHHKIIPITIPKIIPSLKDRERPDFPVVTLSVEVEYCGKLYKGVLYPVEVEEEEEKSNG